MANSYLLTFTFSGEKAVLKEIAKAMEETHELKVRGMMGDEPGDDEEFNKVDATAYRGMVARANYFTQDRSDVQYIVKEL